MTIRDSKLKHDEQRNKISITMRIDDTDLSLIQMIKELSFCSNSCRTKSVATNETKLKLNHCIYKILIY